MICAPLWRGRFAAGMDREAMFIRRREICSCRFCDRVTVFLNS